MVAVQNHGLAFDFDHVEHMLNAVSTAPFQLAAHLDARRKLAAGNGLHQRFVAQAKRIFGCQRQRHGIAFFLAVQCFFNFGQRVAVTPVQINHGAVALLNDLAFVI